MAAGFSQSSGGSNISMIWQDDLSFDLSFSNELGIGLDLSNYDVYANIIPVDSLGVSGTSIPIVITATDVTTGKFHLFISAASIAGMQVVNNQHRWEFVWNYPKQQIPAITVYTRTILSGYFNIEGI